MASLTQSPPLTADPAVNSHLAFSPSSFTLATSEPEHLAYSPSSSTNATSAPYIGGPSCKFSDSSSSVDFQHRKGATYAGLPKGTLYSHNCAFSSISGTPNAWVCGCIVRGSVCVHQGTVTTGNLPARLVERRVSFVAAPRHSPSNHATVPPKCVRTHAHTPTHPHIRTPTRPHAHTPT